MADYHSSLTGPDIDAALTRAKAGGEIDTLLAGKAPAGYGLGKTAYSTKAGTLADIDTYVENGWWRFDAVGVYDAIGVSANHSVLRVDAGRTIVQTLFLSSYDAVVTRRKIATESAWVEWEWVNPPMVVGTEYRTTERYKGKPVYVKLIDLGLSAAGGTVSADSNVSNFESYVFVQAIVGGTATPIFPNTSFTGAWCVYVANLNSTTISVYTGSSRGGEQCYCLLKYTKTTD